MAYRTIKLDWMPRSRTAWRTFTTARVEAARLWADLVARHRRLRRLNWRWPSKARWQAWAKRKYPNLHSQSIQQIITEFCEAVDATRQLRKNGHTDANYPWRRPHYRDVIYTNQAVKLRDGHLLLPNGASGMLCIPRMYRCRGCGCTAPRDVIGSTNIRTVGMFGKLQTGCAVPNSVHFIYPCTYPGSNPGSSGGHPACSPREREAQPL